jgi:hypothetical protein
MNQIVCDCEGGKTNTRVLVTLIVFQKAAMP